jgi:hypothetical protein
MRLFIILVPTIRSFISIKLPIKILRKFARYGRLLSIRTLRASGSKLGWLAIYQVIPMLFLESCILAQSTKIWRHCIITFLHCTIPYASSHNHLLTSAFITLRRSVSIWCNPECILYNLVVIKCFHWPLLDCYILEVYLTPHLMDSPCASSLMLHWPSRSTSLWR